MLNLIKITSKMQHKNNTYFFIDFFMISGAFWVPQGPGTLKILRPFFVFFGKNRQDALKSSQEEPKTPQKAPQEAPKTPPRPPKRLPRRPQDLPRHPQDTPSTSKRLPGRKVYAHRKDPTQISYHPYHPYYLGQVVLLLLANHQCLA